MRQWAVRKLRVGVDCLKTQEYQSRVMNVEVGPS
jgi:hypothetical protein